MEPFRLIRPRMHKTAAIFASPHSGRAYPADFVAASRLSPLVLRSSEDAYVDRLIETAPEHGAPVLLANLPRAYVDLNRGADELDPKLVEGVPSGVRGNARIAAGLGVIPRVVAGGREIYHGRLSLAEARARIKAVHVPYHEALAGLIARSKALFGEAVLFDMHSMPSEALAASRLRKGRAADVVIGDLYGASASEEMTALAEAAFRAEGLVVARNAPFAGAHVARRHGRPARGQHVIQIEIARSLYLDEARIEPSPDFPAFQRLMERVVAKLCRDLSKEAKMAAE